MNREWVRTRLGNLISLEYGKALKDSSRDGLGFPVLGSNGIVGWHSEPLVRGPGIVVGRKGTAGSVTWVETDFFPIDTTYWVRLNNSEMDMQFAYLLLTHCDLPAVCAQTGVPGLNRDRAYEIAVSFPSPPVQHRIVDLMTHMDHHLAILRNERSTAVSFAEALRQHILKPKSGWFVGVLEDVVNIQVGFPFKSIKYTDLEDDIRLLRGDNIEPRGLRWTKAKRWPKGMSVDVAEYLLSDGDVVIAMDRTWITSGLKIAQVTVKDLPALLVQRVARLTAKSNMRQELIRHLVDGSEFEHLVRNEQTGTSVPHISSKQIASFPIAIPIDLAEQKNIASLLDCSTQNVERLGAELSKLEIARDRLLADLLSNRISVPVEYDHFVPKVA